MRTVGNRPVPTKEVVKITLSQYIKSLGITEFGFFREEEPPAKGLTNGISIVVKLSRAVVEQIGKEPTFSYFHHYRTVNTFIDQALLKIGLFIEESGYKYFPVGASQTIPTNDMPYSAVYSHKMAAVKSGLGRIGKNGLFLSHNLGCKVRLGTIFTDMPLPVFEGEINTKTCENCNLCVAACPAMALSGDNPGDLSCREKIVDAAACSKYMKDKFMHIGRGSVCGICMAVCPEGRK